MYDFLAERYPRVAAAHDGGDDARGARADGGAYPQMRHDFTFLRKQTLRDHAREFGYAEAMARKPSMCSSGAQRGRCCMQKCCPALEGLASRYRLFTASNGNADLGKIGLAHFFERSVAARHVGALKPDPADLP